MIAKILLCIDDEPTGLSIRKLVLESAGYQVLTATSGREGLKLFREHRVDAVLLDFHMPPGMHGSEVACRMRQTKPLVPILLLSAYPSLPQEAMACADAYLIKGQSPQVLLEEVSSLLKLQRHTHPELQGEYVAFVDRERHYVEATDGFCRLVGYTRAELIGKGIDDLAAFDTVPERFREYLRVGHQEGYDTLRHRDGSLIPVHFRARVFADGCMACVLEPLSEERQQAWFTGAD